MKETMQILLEARAAGKVLRRAATEQKNKALLEMADSLEHHAADILDANALDVAEWSGSLGPVMTDRLALSKERIRGMADGGNDTLSIFPPSRLYGIMDGSTEP